MSAHDRPGPMGQKRIDGVPVRYTGARRFLQTAGRAAFTPWITEGNGTARGARTTSRASATPSSWSSEKVPVEVERHRPRLVSQHLLGDLHVRHRCDPQRRGGMATPVRGQTRNSDALGDRRRRLFQRRRGQGYTRHPCLQVGRNASTVGDARTLLKRCNLFDLAQRISAAEVSGKPAI